MVALSRLFRCTLQIVQQNPASYSPLRTQYSLQVTHIIRKTKRTIMYCNKVVCSLKAAKNGKRIEIPSAGTTNTKPTVRTVLPVKIHILQMSSHLTWHWQLTSKVLQSISHKGCNNVLRKSSNSHWTFQQCQISN